VDQDQVVVLDRELGLLFADAALALLEHSDTAPAAVTAIGSHGQTVRHHPPSAAQEAEHGFTLQAGDPNTIAEITGITTVADFRRRDIAAGGEGAPLAPLFHAAALSAANVQRAIVNVGGIANVTLLEGKHLRAGFDTGPGNTLMDAWHQRHRGSGVDVDGAWAAQGSLHNALLDRLLAHPYFGRSGPRSTGKEAFNLAWLDGILEQCPAEPAEVQATLAELTAITICRAICASRPAVAEIYVCGGGAHNKHLMTRLTALAPAPVATTADLGIAPDWVEAATFAWLARQCLAGVAAGDARVTGAAGPRVLGAIYPAEPGTVYAPQKYEASFTD